MDSTHCSAYIIKDSLHVVGVHETPNGVIPFYYKRKVEGNPPEGPVSVGGDLHPAVEKGINKSEGPIMYQIEQEKMKRTAESLVDRARLGEQNAVAVLAGIRENAKKNNPRAKAAFQLCMNYLKSGKKSTPPKKPSGFSGMFDNPLSSLRVALKRITNPTQYAAIVVTHVPSAGGTIKDNINAANILSTGPHIDQTMLTSIKNALSSPVSQKAFVCGVKLSAKPGNVLAVSKRLPNDRELQKGLQLGFTVGAAKRMQDVAKDEKTPIRAYSEVAAWELGESI